MTLIRSTEALAAAVMPGVVVDFAVQQPAAPAVSWSVSTRDADVHSAPPRVVWVPWRDDFRGPEKRGVGGSHAQRSMATRVVGVRAVLWAGDVTATEDLVECLVRRLLRAAGSGAPGVTVQSGTWVDDVGALTAGEGYSLFFSFPLDVRAQAEAPPARPTVTPVLQTAGAGTPGDGALDSEDL